MRQEDPRLGAPLCAAAKPMPDRIEGTPRGAISFSSSAPTKLADGFGLEAALQRDESTDGSTAPIHPTETGSPAPPSVATALTGQGTTSNGLGAGPAAACSRLGNGGPRAGYQAIWRGP